MVDMIKNKKETKVSPEKKPKKVLVICAHSDDQIIGAGATLAKFAAEGQEVITLILSKGEFSHPIQKGRYTMKTRVKESEEANKVIEGHDLKFFNLHEGKFLEEYRTLGVFQNIRKIMQKHQPYKIFTHSYDDAHIDHRNTFNITSEAIDSIEGFKPELLTFDVWNLIDLKKRKYPTAYVDVTNYAGKKIKALKCFKSQKIAMINLSLQIYLSLFINGLRIGRLFAEKFYKVR
jgi:LmbE family N-acetylglucosaminyl deacetylase